MSRQVWAAEGWFYKQAGERCGPVSVERLKELLAAGLLQPRQVVWQRGSDGLFFLPAATAAFGTTAPLCRPPSEPVPA